MNNTIQILENGDMFFMPDTFTGNTLIFETGPDNSASITIRTSDKDVSIILWPKDLEALKKHLINNVSDIQEQDILNIAEKGISNNQI